MFSERFLKGLISGDYGYTTRNESEKDWLKDYFKNEGYKVGVDIGCFLTAYPHMKKVNFYSENFAGDDEIINPTYDDLKPLFSDTKPKEVEDVDLDIALEYDTVERPKHYNVFEREVIYTIKDLLDNNNNYRGFDNYCIGNSLKYIFRAGLKGDYYEDLEKARYYINKILEGKES